MNKPHVTKVWGDGWRVGEWLVSCGPVDEECLAQHESARDAACFGEEVFFGKFDGTDPGSGIAGERAVVAADEEVVFAQSDHALGKRQG